MIGQERERNVEEGCATSERKNAINMRELSVDARRPVRKNSGNLKKKFKKLMCYRGFPGKER